MAAIAREHAPFSSVFLDAVETHFKIPCAAFVTFKGEWKLRRFRALWSFEQGVDSTSTVGDSETNIQRRLASTTSRAGDFGGA